MLRIAVLVLLTLFLGCKEEIQPPDIPQVSISDIEILEGDTDTKSVILTLYFSIPAEIEGEIKISTISVTATESEDYVPLTNEIVSFTPGEQSKSIILLVNGDEEVEPNETLQVTISDPINAQIATSVATVTILNDDEAPVVIPASGYVSPTSYSGMNLIWQDEFDGTGINDTYWTFETGGGGWGNQELQYYRTENAYLVQGNLVIEARNESFGGRNYTSTRMITKDKFDFQYGRVDIRANLPVGQGIWPALWMLGADFDTAGWPHCGEIDIMEMIGGQGRENTVHGTAHWQSNTGKADLSGSTTLSNGIFNDEFHVFSIVWTEDKIEWFLDGNTTPYHQLTISISDRDEFRQSFFFIFNVAVGGIWPGNPDNTTTFPQRMIVDYVRVFQNQ